MTMINNKNTAILSWNLQQRLFGNHVNPLKGMPTLSVVQTKNNGTIGKINQNFVLI